MVDQLVLQRFDNLLRRNSQVPGFNARDDSIGLADPIGEAAQADVQLLGPIFEIGLRAGVGNAHRQEKPEEQQYCDGFQRGYRSAVGGSDPARAQNSLTGLTDLSVSRGTAKSRRNRPVYGGSAGWVPSFPHLVRDWPGELAVGSRIVNAGQRAKLDGREFGFWRLPHSRDVVPCQLC